jgi:hypothetical protein
MTVPGLMTDWLQIYGDYILALCQRTIFVFSRVRSRLALFLPFSLSLFLSLPIIVSFDSAAERPQTFKQNTAAK